VATRSTKAACFRLADEDRQVAIAAPGDVMGDVTDDQAGETGSNQKGGQLFCVFSKVAPQPIEPIARVTVIRASRAEWRTHHPLLNYASSPIVITSQIAPIASAYGPEFQTGLVGKLYGYWERDPRNLFRTSAEGCSRITLGAFNEGLLVRRQKLPCR
jgi:hypothetical protein